MPTRLFPDAGGLYRRGRASSRRSTSRSSRPWRRRSRARTTSSRRKAARPASGPRRSGAPHPRPPARAPGHHAGAAVDPAGAGERQVAGHQDQQHDRQHHPALAPAWLQAVTIYRMGEAADSVKAASDLTNELLKQRRVYRPRTPRCAVRSSAVCSTSRRSRRQRQAGRHHQREPADRRRGQAQARGGRAAAPGHGGRAAQDPGGGLGADPGHPPTVRPEPIEHGQAIAGNLGGH